MVKARGRRWSTPLGRWVSTYPGREAGLAREVGVTRQAVAHWLAGRRVPALPRAQRLVELSGGTLRLEDLLGQRRAREGEP